MFAVEGGQRGAPPLRRAPAVRDVGLRLDQTPGADRVVGQGVPQGDGLDLLRAAHEKLRQSSIGRLSVGTFSRRGALLADFLGLVLPSFAGSPSPTPRGHDGTIVVLRGMALTAGIARLRRRR